MVAARSDELTGTYRPAYARVHKRLRGFNRDLTATAYIHKCLLRCRRRY